MPTDPRQKRERHEVLRQQLDNERSTFTAHWRDLSDYLLPRRARFYTSDVNKGDRRNLKIIDPTGTLALRTLKAGMMSGITSPARPWFRLSTPDPDLANFGPVKEWLHDVTQRMTSTFLRSNLYNSLPIVYGDMGGFGTSAMLVEEDFEQTLRTYPFPIGSYYIANNDRLKVEVFFREFQMTVRQLVQKFGSVEGNKPKWDNFSIAVKNHWDRGNYETWITVCHVIQRNPEFNPKMGSSKSKKYESCYYEKGYTGNNNSANYITDVDKGKYLRESGYDFFPIIAPRWEITGEDVYGTSCPGMEALGDIKQLQVEQKRKAQAIEKMVNPPMTGPTSLKNAKASILPGDMTFVDEREGQKGFRPAHEVDPRIRELMEDIQDVRRNISRTFFEDLFLMMAQSDRRDITAREIDERHEEKLLALGPVLEQLNQDALDPLIDLTFDIMLRQGQIPPPPEELQGSDLKVEYTSVMAQAQKLVGIAGIERFAAFAGNIVKLSGDPQTVDKVNFDELIDAHGDAVGVPPKVVRTDEEVAELRQGRQQAQQQAQQAELLNQGADTVKKLADSKLEDDSALKRLGQAIGVK